MLPEGTERRSSTELAAAAERLGTQWNVDSSMDGVNAGLSVLTNHADDALDLLADVVRHPAFRDADIERIRKRRVVSIQQEADSPFAIAFRVAPRLIYGDQPYAFTDSGTEASAQATTREQLRKLLGGALRAGRLRPGFRR